MALFRRKRRAGEETVGRRVVVTDDLDLDADYADDDLDVVDGDYEDVPAERPSLDADASDGPDQPREETGPFDRSEVDDTLGDRLDLGSLWLGVVGGAQLRIEVDPQTSEIQAVTTDLDGSAMQVQAFAAPRTRGIWRTIRTEIADSVAARGGEIAERRGPLGAELLTRLPSRGPDGRVATQEMRFIGVDGPRWFLRGVLTGPAATADDAAEPFYDMIRRSVVVRGDDARPPREMLPLRMPADLLDSPADQAQGIETGEGEEGGRRADDLNPFERGPEITEVR